MPDSFFVDARGQLIRRPAAPYLAPVVVGTDAKAFNLTTEERAAIMALPVTDPARIALASEASTGGGGSGSTPVTVPASTTMVLDASKKVYGNLTLTGNTTINVSGSVPGAEALMPITGNGTATVTVAGATEDLSNMYFDTANGAVSTLYLWNNGIGFKYAFSRDAVSAPAPAPAPAVAPGAPASFTAGAVGPTSQVLNWTAPATGSPASYTYSIARRVNGSGAFPSPQQTGLTGLTTTVTGLTPSTSYDYQITATNTAGTGPVATLTAQSTSASLAVPGAVVSPAAGTPASTSVALTWSAPSTGGGSITDYVVQYATAGTSFSSPTTVADGTSATPGATVSGLTASTAYDFRVAAVNATGQGAWSSTVTATTAASGGSDADVDAWMVRVAAASGTVGSTAEAAVRTFVASAKANNYWATFKRLNLFAGDASAAMVPLVNTSGTTTDTNAGMTYAEATGVQTNGTSQYIDTGYSPVGATGDLSVYLRTTQPSDTTARAIIGTRDNATHVYVIRANVSNAGTATAGHVNSAYGGTVSGVRPTAASGGMSAGLWQVSRIAPTDAKLYRNGTQVATATTSATPADPSFPIFVGAWNSLGTAANFPAANTQIGAYSIGSGMTSAEAAAYYADLQVFQTALGRQV